MTFIKRLVFWLIGIVILSLGASLTIKANMGVGAWDALNVGLSKMTGLTVGSFVIIMGLILLFVNALLLKTRPDYLAVFTFFIIGTLIDFWLLVMLVDFNPSTSIFKFTTLVIGLLVIGIGVAMYLQPKFPINPLDNFMVGISQRLGVSFVVAKTIGEVIALVFALIVGGPIGFGTLIVTLGIGPCIQLFVPFSEKVAINLGIKN
ncbi:YczE/YyaS/YitT family protein [Pseudoneobacillus sp. C159]